MIGRIIKSGLKIIQVENKYEVTDRLEILVIDKDRKMHSFFKSPGIFDPRHLGMEVNIEYKELLDGTNEIVSIAPYVSIKESSQ